VSAQAKTIIACMGKEVCSLDERGNQVKLQSKHCRLWVIFACGI